MSNPFGKDGGPVKSVPRNAFDLSFQNNLTCEFGGLYPVLCKEVIPGDSFKIDTTFGLRFMPTAFPLQTRIRAHIHYFYVRNRNLWKDWPDFFGKTKKGLSFPTISPDVPDSFYSTGSLSDYLGVPTSVYGQYSNFSFLGGVVSPDSPSFGRVSVDGVLYNQRWIVGSTPEPPLSNGEPVSAGSILEYSIVDNPRNVTAFSSVVLDLLHTFSANSVCRLTVKFDYLSMPDGYTPFNVVGLQVPIFLASGDNLAISGVYQGFVVGRIVSFDSSTEEHTIEFTLSSPISAKAVIFGNPYGRNLPVKSALLSYGSLVSFFDYPNLVNRPYTESNYIHLSALPFRAYESIYNSFYRDERNNPFIINGEKEYNKYIPTDAGGFDSTPYQIRFRNWEQDFLTTAVPTPQQGDAPLVGISSTGVMSIQDSETGKVYQVMAKTADDADTIVGADVRENLPTSVMRSIVNYASSGISINDFRNVNAMQRWLETNIRRGFKYRDQIKSHFDVDVSYQELDMPEFIGGVSCDVTPSTVSQTSQDSLDNPLGSYAGQLYGSGGSNNSVSKYFDEHGFIIGIMSVVPVPNYSQLLPKHFLKTTDSLDYYTPEFGHIGLQPILNQEVSPLQTTEDNSSSVFGYQRAWYDYLQSVDEVHGQFRTDLRNFVMNRVFDNLPVLGPSFTVIDPKQLNDVFTVREVDGKPVQPILGQIYFNISSKRPIPRYGVPRLE
ncbi:major capsid protein [Dipodfec virus UOA04_Rod_495]|nr:major capsid protein [Dipodfec virus UOA04_Rod_495]